MNLSYHILGIYISSHSLVFVSLHTGAKEQLGFSTKLQNQKYHSAPGSLLLDAYVKIFPGSRQAYLKLAVVPALFLLPSRLGQ